jgi:DNA-binding NarL/FixJ family response regulator
MKTIEDFKIIIADDHPLYRKGLKKVLSTLSFPTEIQLFENGQLALNQAKNHTTDLVFLDLDMPIMDGLSCLKELKKLDPSPKVIMISMHDDMFHIEQAYALGANGYLLKDCDSDELHLAVKKIRAGEKYFHSRAKEIIYHRFIEKSDNVLEKKQTLSERETEVLELICKQCTGAEIANKLFISEETVKTYRRQLLKKTNSKNLAGLVLFAIKSGIYSG